MSGAAVMPAAAGIQSVRFRVGADAKHWIRASAVMTAICTWRRPGAVARAGSSRER
jgi:hypothetical protein